MESSRRFKPPWTLVRENSECYVVRDANGVTLAWLYCRDDTQRYSFGASKLSSDEARRIGKAIARIPEFLMPRRGFYPRGGGPRWRADRPYHVALEDRYIREHWDEIYALCKLNSLPFNDLFVELTQGTGGRAWPRIPVLLANTGTQITGFAMLPNGDTAVTTFNNAVYRIVRG